MVRRILLILLMIPGALPGQRAPKTAVLYGSVLTDPNDRPLAGAEVVVSPSFATRTDSAGDFIIRNITPGVHEIRVRHLGNAPLISFLTFEAGDSLGRDFVLDPEITRLDTVHVTAPAVSDFIRLGKMAGFAERKRLGFGAFLDSTVFGAERGRRLAEILQTHLQVRVMRYGSASAIATRRGTSMSVVSGDRADRLRGAKPACYSQVFLDGMRVYQPLRDVGLFDVNSVPAESIQAIEYYASPASTPAQYGGLGANCGTLLLWTK
jgi:hypothetical protein